MNYTTPQLTYKCATQADYDALKALFGPVYAPDGYTRTDDDAGKCIIFEKDNPEAF